MLVMLAAEQSDWYSPYSLLSRASDARLPRKLSCRYPFLGIPTTV